MPSKQPTRTASRKVAATKRKPSTSKRAADEDSSVISEESIRSRAYEIWENEGYQDGNQLNHWLRAEAELRQS